MPADWPKRNHALPDYQPDDAGNQPHKSADRRRNEKTLDGSHDAASAGQTRGRDVGSTFGVWTETGAPS